MITVTPTGSPPISALMLRIFTPQKGAWFADADLDLQGATPPLTTAPSGKCVISIDIPETSNTPPSSATLVGTIDPLASGRFAGGARVRIVGGGGGWAMQVPRQHFSKPSLTSQDVEAVTATAVGETVVDSTPQALGTDYVRVAGPAARVFGDRQWYVDPTTGITNVASWPTPIPPTDLEVLGYDPNMMLLEAASNTPLTPGLLLTDTQGSPPRWDGALTVVDVEQTFTAQGSRANLWVSSGGQSRLLSTLTSLIRELSRRDLAGAYQYRIVSQSGSQLNLQAVNASLGIPDCVKINIMGPAGVSAMYTPGGLVMVMFLDRDPTQPRVVGFDSTQPISLALQGGGAPIGRVGDTITITAAQFAAATPTVGPGVAAGSTVVIAAPLQGTITSGSPTVSSG